MTAHSYSNGHPIQYTDAWRYLDGQIATEPRPCPKCHQLPTPEGHDACLGTIPGVTSACCGHGVRNGWTMPTKEDTNG